MGSGGGQGNGKRISTASAMYPEATWCQTIRWGYPAQRDEGVGEEMQGELKKDVSNCF